MKKLYILVACGLALASPAAVQAQTDFRPGYIVRSAGDTVRGEVDYRDARFNARQCRFRATPDVAAATLAPTELLAYGLRDGGKLRQYRALVVPHGCSGQGLNTWSNRFYALLTLGLTK